MFIKTLRLKNFRQFQDFEITFNQQLTVITARNGQGKTSILDAVTIALGTFVGAFDFGKACHLAQSDARYTKNGFSYAERTQQYPVHVYAEFDEPLLKGFRELTGKKNKTTIKDASEISSYGKELQQKVREGQTEPLPIIAYYGSGRLWKTHKNMAREHVLSESRTIGYEDCLSPVSNFVQVQQWMAKATYAELQQQARAEKETSIAIRLKTVENAVNQVLKKEGWDNFHYDLELEELAMTSLHFKTGDLPISLLSDGLRAMIALVADLAFRCVRLNGFWGEEATLKTQGIVLIDEIDLHLHPEWQQYVIDSLRKVFPLIQFIVTTHSPQVLSTVKQEQIRVIGENVNRELIASIPLGMTYGEPSQSVLQGVMFVDPQPPVKEKVDLQRLTELVDQGCYETSEAKELQQKLEASLGKTHPQLQRLQRSIERQQRLKK